MGTSYICVMRKCASMVTVRRYKLRGIITGSNATLDRRRVQLLRHFASGVALLCSNSRTNVGTDVQNVSVLLTRNVGVGILLLPSKSSPSDFSEGRGTARFEGCVSSRRRGFVHFGAGLLLGSTRESPVGQTKLVSSVTQDVKLVPSGMVQCAYLARYTALLGMGRRVVLSRVGGRLLRQSSGCLRRVGGRGSTSTAANSLPPTSAPFPTNDVPPTSVPALNISSGIPPPFPPTRTRTKCRSCVPRRKQRGCIFCMGRRLLLRALVHRKRGIVYCMRARRGARAPLAIVRCVSVSLGRSRLRFRGPLRQGVLTRTRTRLRSPGFATRHCFLTRPSPAVDGLTTSVVGSHCRLDGDGSRTVIGSRRHLRRLMPRRLVSFGLTVLRRSVGCALRTLGGPRMMTGTSGYLRIVTRFGRLDRLRGVVTGHTNSQMMLGWERGSLSIVPCRVRGFLAYFDLIGHADRVEDDDGNVLFLRPTRLRTRILNFSRCRRSRQVRNFLGAFFCLRYRAFLCLRPVEGRVRCPNGLARANSVAVKGVDGVYLSVGQGRVIFTRERRVGVFRSGRLAVLFFRFDSRRGNVQVLFVATYRYRRDFNCTLEDFRRSFSFCVFAR